MRFGLDLSLDVAEQEVQAAINAANSLLPGDLPAPPIYNKVNPTDTILSTRRISQLAGISHIRTIFWKTNGQPEQFRL